MWKVLRRYQGEDYTEPGSVPPRYVHETCCPPESRRPDIRRDDAEVTLRTLGRHQCRPYPKELDPMELTAPYDRLVYEKLVRYMSHENVIMRRKALQSLLELYGEKGEHVVLSLHHGTIPALVKRLSDTDEEVRVGACIALEVAAEQPAGQAEILEKGFLKDFLAAVDDPSPEVAAEALRLLCSVHAAANGSRCTAELLKLGSMKKFVEKAKSTIEDVACMAFAAMNKTFDVKEAFIEVLDCGGMDVAVSTLLSCSDALLLAEAAECIGKLAYYGAGKRAAVRHQACKALIPLLSHEKTVTRNAVSGALCAVTIESDGKIQAIDNWIVKALVEAIQNESDTNVLAMHIKLLCNIAEHPYARLQLHEIVPTLEDLAAAHESLVSSIELALKMVRWNPGDEL